MHSDNAQDGVILGLLFDGLSHRNEFEELTNLTKDQVDFDNCEIELEDRVIPISHQTRTLIRHALDQDRKYVSINGETVRNYNIAKGNNIIRGVRNKSKVKGPNH